VVRLTWNVSSSIQSYIEQMLLVRRMSAITHPAATILLAWMYNLDKYMSAEFFDT
jgi:hypothetical protein